MKMIFRVALMVATVILLLPLAARAEIKAGSFEVEPFAGYNFFEHGQNLQDYLIYGGRVGYNFTRYFGMEGVVEYMQSRVDDRSIRGNKEGQFRSPINHVYLTMYHLDAVYHPLPDSSFNPFIVAGIGGLHYHPSISHGDMPAFNVGIGAKYWVTDNIALRVDVRDYVVTEIFHDSYNNLAVTAGITYAFGGKAK